MARVLAFVRRNRFLIPVALLTLILGLPTLLYPYGCDQAAFTYVGLVWNRGGLPYRDAWDIKPPAIYAIYAISQWFDHDRMRSFHWLDLLNTAFAAFFLGATVARRYGRWSGLFTGVLFGSLTYLAFDLREIGQCESFAAGPLAVALWIATREKVSARGWVTIGVMIGWILLLKTPLLLLGVVAVPALLSSRKEFVRNCALLVAGITVPVALFAAYFALHGAFGYLIELVRMQFAYNSGGYTGFTAGGMIQRVFSEKLVFVLLMLVAMLVITLSPKQWSNRTFSVASSVFAVSVLLIVIQGRYYSYHWLVLLPAACMLLGIAAGKGFERATRYPLVNTVAAVGVYAIPLLISVRLFGLAMARLTGAITTERYYAIESPIGGNAVPGYKVAEIITKACPPGGKVLPLNLFDPRIMAFSGATCASRRFIGAYNGYGKELQRMCIEETSQLFKTSPPELLICQGPPFQPGLETKEMLDLTRRQKEHAIQKMKKASKMDVHSLTVLEGIYVWPDRIEPFGVPYQVVGSAESFYVYRRL